MWCKNSRSIAEEQNYEQISQTNKKITRDSINKTLWSNWKKKKLEKMESWLKKTKKQMATRLEERSFDV